MTRLPLGDCEWHDHFLGTDRPHTGAGTSRARAASRSGLCASTRDRRSTVDPLVGGSKNIGTARTDVLNWKSPEFVSGHRVFAFFL